MDEKFIDPLGRSNPVAALGAEQEFTSEIGRFQFCPRLCKNSACQLAHRKSFSIFVNRRTNSAADHDREKAVEKTILRNLSSCTFLHSLAPFQTLRDASPNGSAGWKGDVP